MRCILRLIVVGALLLGMAPGAVALGTNSLLRIIARGVNTGEPTEILQYYKMASGHYEWIALPQYTNAFGGRTQLGVAGVYQMYRVWPTSVGTNSDLSGNGVGEYYSANILRCSVEYWGERTAVVPYAYYIHNHAAGTWETLYGDAAGPVGGWPDGQYISRYDGDGGKSCSPYPFGQVDGQYPIWYDKTAVPPTNSPSPATNLPAYTPPGITNFPPYVPDAVTNVVAPANSNVDLSAVYAYLQQVRDSVSGSGSGVASRVSASIDAGRTENQANLTALDRDLNDGFKQLTAKFNATNIWKVSFTNSFGVGQTNSMTVNQFSNALGSGAAGWTGSESNEINWSRVQFESIAGSSTSFTYAAAAAAYSNLYAKEIIWRSRVQSTHNSPTFFLRSWAAVWSMTFPTTWFGTVMGSRLGLDLEGDAWLRTRDVIGWVRACLAWMLLVVYWWGLFRLHVWLFGGPGIPIPGINYAG